MKSNPHRTRRTNIHLAFLLIALLGILLAANMGCSPKYGCPKTQHIIGVSKISSNKIKRLIDKYNGRWMYCVETGKVCVFNPEGKLIGYYHEKH